MPSLQTLAWFGLKVCQAVSALLLSLLMFLDQTSRNMRALARDRFELFPADLIVGNKKMLNLFDYLRVQHPQRFQRRVSIRFGRHRDQTVVAFGFAITCLRRLNHSQ